MRWLPVWSASVECFDRVLKNNGSLQLFAPALRLIGANNFLKRTNYVTDNNFYD